MVDMSGMLVLVTVDAEQLPVAAVRRIVVVVVVLVMHRELLEVLPTELSATARANPRVDAQGLLAVVPQTLVPGPMCLSHDPVQLIPVWGSSGWSPGTWWS